MCGNKSTLSIKMASIALATGMVIASSAAWAGGNETRLEARLAAAPSEGDISGKGDFRDRDSRRKFSVQVEGFTEGQMFDVEVAGVIVGKVVIDAFGMGDINFDTNFEAGDDDPATQFPGGFPMLNGGEQIEVGPLSGTLQLK